MKAGDLRHKITIQKPTRTKDTHGRITTTWSKLRDCYAAVYNVSSRDFYAAAAYHMEDIVTFTVRYSTDVVSNMRILFQNKAYEIIEVNHLSYQGDYMTMKARLVAEEG